MSTAPEDGPGADPTARRAEVTRALAGVSRGEPSADTRLLQLVYAELKRIAAAKMASQDPGHTLQPTALVHEAYLRLLGPASGAAPAFRDGAHFFGAAAAAMRSILVDHARRKRASKRGDQAPRVTLHEDLVGAADPMERILSVHEVLDRLAAEHPRPAKVVELLFFAGLAAEEAAAALGVSDRTVKRDWRFGRAWLLRELEGT
jgi:RNA polymerase sigma factor (TIGR02999 family)